MILARNLALSEVSWGKLEFIKKKSTKKNRGMVGDRQYDFRIPTVELFSCIVLTASEVSQDYSIEPAWTLLCHCTIANYVSVDLVRFQF